MNRPVLAICKQFIKALSQLTIYAANFFYNDPNPQIGIHYANDILYETVFFFPIADVQMLRQLFQTTRIFRQSAQRGKHSPLPLQPLEVSRTPDFNQQLLNLEMLVNLLLAT
ncbi:hypothetical protein SAMN05444390_103441 [Marinobacterium lutimaris]|uniref:Uncharacterized protein n=1 Tax=Marinobacterium lutimaris TaxID=568106 RepID=A0A1H6CF63_9GAMM|nr:hypothetical protein SAMN05444390_103441 [Marinobacterium lutimaris]